MTTVTSPADIIAVLQDIERRSRQGISNSSAQDGNHKAWTAIGFRIAHDNFLIPLNETLEIFPVPKQVTPVPKSEPWVFGIANLRGEMLPLFDLKYFLSGQATKLSKRSRIIVINHPELYSGLLLDEVFGLKHFPQEPDYNNSSADDSFSPYLNGNISQQEEHWNVFSFHKLTADLRFLNAAA